MGDTVKLLLDPEKLIKDEDLEVIEDCKRKNNNRYGGK